jgi:hypothetical protein
MPIESWRDRALCQAAADLPWIGEPSDASSEQLTVMEVVCGACPVCFECLEAAGCYEVTAGFWAGAYRTAAPVSGGDVA